MRLSSEQNANWYELEPYRPVFYCPKVATYVIMQAPGFLTTEIIQALQTFPRETLFSALSFVPQHKPVVYRRVSTLLLRYSQEKDLTMETFGESLRVKPEELNKLILFGSYEIAIILCPLDFNKT